jgi:electron transfer flavoprotein alpha subunit
VIAVIPVRQAVLPIGTAEALEAAGGRVLVVGEGTAEAAESLARAGGVAGAIRCAELGRYRPAAWAALLAPLLSEEAVVIVPAVPDGRDLAPHLAARLGRPLLAGASEVSVGGAVVVRVGGLQSVRLAARRPFVVTLLPGPRSSQPAEAAPAATGRAGGVEVIDVTPPDHDLDAEVGNGEPTPLGILEPDPATADLHEAARIVAGGAGLGGPEAFALLWRLGEALGASVGATRVVTDGGIVGHDRQIGTTGVSVRPRLYLAFGISGAAQHVGGLGEPAHVVSVNLDPSCPMMAMADLAVVADAAATVAALERRLHSRTGLLGVEHG